ncbi:MAG: glycoside hydrolase domain-containing protein, partial [Planctomycetota bacterium]
WSAGGPPQSADGVSYGFDDPGRESLGKRSVRMHVPHDVRPTWRGWQQGVPVRPGRTYLLAAWVKCDDVRGGDVHLHAHRHRADGSLSEHNPMVSCGPSISGTADWTLLSGRFTMPEDTVNFRIHLTMNATGTVWHDGVLLTEIVRGTVVRLEGRPLEQAAPFSLWQVPAVVKVFQDDPAPRETSPTRISAARNEKEPLQLAVRSARALRDVRVEVDPPTGPEGANLDDLEVNVVGYVPIDHPTSYYQSDSPEWRRKIPTQPGRSDGWPGAWPDPLLPCGTFDLAANTTQPIWITVGVGRDAPAGDYSGTVRLVCEGECVAETPFTVHVWDFSLPDESHVAAIYDVRLGPGSKFWGKTIEELYPEIVRFMARRRLCPDTIHPAPVIKVENGRLVTDFTEFDKMAEVYFDELKLPFAYTPWQFYLFGWGHPPKTLFGQRPYPGDPPYEGVDRSTLQPEYKKTYQMCLKAFWDHLKEKGWEKKVVLYISDEPFDHHEHIREQMKALVDMIHEVDPQIPIYSSTWKHVPEWDGYLDVWGIGHYGRVSPEKMAELRAAGDRLWFTTDGQMCTDTPYCAVERLLPHYCFKYGVEAYEFWGVGWLTYDPYQFGWHSFIHQTSEPGRSTWVRYPNGDGFLLYPGAPVGHSGLVSSLRLEQAREGVEDYEYLFLLRRLVTEAKSAGRDTSEADAAMALAAELVTIPNAGGLRSSQILPDPEAVYQVRRALAAAIEKLAR